MTGCSWFALLAVLAPFTALAEAPPAAASHPLAPLSAAELKQAVSILQREHSLGAAMMFPLVTLREPPKAEVLAFKPGQPFRREAAATVFDRKKNQTFDAVVDLKTGKTITWQAQAGVHPPVMLSEFDKFPAGVKADARFVAAMQRRGIKNLDEVAVDIWGYGTPPSAAAMPNRLLRGITYFKGSGTDAGDNFYARPIEGVTAIIDATEEKVIEVIDTGVFPLPPQRSDLDVKSIGKQRTGLQPLVVTQPKGPSFTTVDGETRWQNWRFRFSMHPREGLVLHQVSYDDAGKSRPVLYRGSLSEMMVPYGHNDGHWTWRAAFDEGEYGIGRYSGSLAVGDDVPSYATLFDASFADDVGKVYTTKNAVAMYERDAGLLWKHYDMYTGKNESRRGRDLVVTFITTISNYDYGLSWVFHQDGSLELETLLSGIMLAKGSHMTTMSGGHDHSSPDARFGHLVAPHVVAPHHQHFFNMRLDLDVDGAGDNAVAELNSLAVPAGKDNPDLNAFEMTMTQLKSEKGAVRDLDYASQRKWAVYNTTTSNALGYRPSYILIPGENAAPYLSPKSLLRKRGGFIEHPVWFTQLNESEMHAAGEFPTQRPSADGLPVWIKQDRALDNNDVVLWYNFCVTHAPRPEEWPVMVNHKTGFKLVPAGFFDRNPALDVPPTGRR